MVPSPVGSAERHRQEGRTGSHQHASQAALPMGADKAKLVRQMFDTIARRYETLNTVMTFGMDRGWRRRCVQALGLQPGAHVLDVACGTGDLCRELARQRMRATGLDLSSEMLRYARTPAPLVLGDALAAPFKDGAFDGAVSGFALRNMVDLGDLFAELARLVRPDGRLALLDMSVPDNPLLRAGHRLWCSYGVPTLGAALSDRAAYRYLPRSLVYLPPPEGIAERLEMAGFAAVEREPLSGGVCQLYTASRRPRPRRWS